MKYENNHQNIAETTVTTALLTIEDNIEALSQLLLIHENENSSSQQNDPVKNARIISIGVAAIEKLLMINLYSRNPVFLLLPVHQQLKRSKKF